MATHLERGRDEFASSLPPHSVRRGGFLATTSTTRSPAAGECSHCERSEAISLPRIIGDSKRGPRPSVCLGRHLDWVRQTLARWEPGYRFKWDVYFERLEELAKTATRFLDAGCGDNKTASELEGPRLGVGIDLIPYSSGAPPEGWDEALSLRRFRSRRVSGRLEKLPFRGDTFDLVGCRHVIEHLDDPLAVFAELHRAMTPGGRLLIQTVNRSSLLIAVSRLLGGPVRRWLRRHRYGRRDADLFALRDRFNHPSLFENPPDGFRLVSIEMTQDVDLQSRFGFWVSYLLVCWTRKRPNRRSTITAEWERV